MKIFFKKLKIFSFLIICIYNTITFSENKEIPSFNETDHITLDNHTIDKVRNAIVTINTRTTISAYYDSGSWTGTGFIVDKEKGIILTNCHVTGGATVGNFLVTFNNGRQAEAKLLYYDLWQDYAFLKISTEEMPKSVTQINFSKAKPYLNQKVYIIGNNEGKEFSFHTGNLSSLYEINGVMPQSSFIVNLNNAGGSSGSPLMNEDNEAIGIIYGGGKTYALALTGDYVKNSLVKIQQNNIPTRQHVGILTTLYSLDKAVKHRSFPKKLMEDYLEKFPDTRNKVILIHRTLAGSPAEKLLRAGDIIWSINGTEPGGDLAVVDQIMNESKDQVTFTIYREGEKLTQIVPLYNINKNKVEQILDFAGAIIFQSDDLFTSQSGIPLGSIAIKNVHTGSSFSTIPVNFTYDNRNVYSLVINSINKYNLKNLDQLIDIVPTLTKQKFLNVSYTNYQPYYPDFSYANNFFITAHENLTSDFELDSTDSTPRVLKFDNQSHEWIVDITKCK